MPNFGSAISKFLLKRRVKALIDNPCNSDNLGISTRPDEPIAAPRPYFVYDGIATKDIQIDPLSSMSVRIFLPQSCLQVFSESNSPIAIKQVEAMFERAFLEREGPKCYLPDTSENYVKLPLVIQFHGGGFAFGSSGSESNDFFCRRTADLCKVIVLAVGYRLAPENKYPDGFEDGMKVLHWLAKQAANVGGEAESRKEGISDDFCTSMVEPWLAAHGDPNRCILLGVSCGANIADYVARKSVEAGRLLDPVKVIAQILMCPFFIGSVPTLSEIRLANSYMYDKELCILLWKLVLHEEEFSLDHPAANPLVPDRGPPLDRMPPTLTVVAEHDLMRDRAIAYTEELRKVNVDALFLEYKDAVHEFATLDSLLKTPQAQACAEDIAFWIKEHILLDTRPISRPVVPRWMKWWQDPSLGKAAEICFRTGLVHFEQNQLSDALSCFNEVFRALAKDKSHGVDIKAQATICAQYKVAVTLLQEIERLQKVQGPCDLCAKVEIARLSRYLGSLPLREEHRVNCILTTIDRNLDVLNLAYAKQMLELICPSQQDVLRSRIDQLTKLSNKSINPLEDPSQFCAATLSRLYDVCDLCGSKFSALCSPGCIICGMGIITRSEAISGSSQPNSFNQVKDK